MSKGLFLTSVAHSSDLFAERPGRFSPAELFRSGEQGVFVDPFDLSSMFQDNTGTTPVTGPGQSVGLVLDKSKGLVLGPELVTNGGFDTAAGWAANSGWTISDGVASWSAPTGNSLSRPLDTPMTAGRSYRVTLDLVYVSGAGAIVGFNGGGGIDNGPTLSAGPVRRSFVVTATLNRTGISITGIGNSVLSIDNISVRELPGNHATQATPAAKPTLGRHPVPPVRRNLLVKTEALQHGANWVSAGFDQTPVEVFPGIWGIQPPVDFQTYAVYDRTNNAFIVPRTAWPISSGRFSVTFTAPPGCTVANVYAAGKTGDSQVYSTTANSAVIPGQTYTYSLHVNDGKVGGLQRELGAVMTAYQPVYDEAVFSNGRRNRMPRNDWSFLPVGVSLTTVLIDTNFSVRANMLPGTGITAICTGYGVAAGVPWVDLALSGTNSRGGVVDLTTRQEANMAVVANQQFTISGTAQVISGSATGLQFSVGAQIRNGTSFVRSFGSGYSSASTTPASMTATTTIASSGENNVNYNAITVRIANGATVDATLRLSGIQAEDSGFATTVQRVISQYDVTEGGVPNVWYMYHDGADDWLTTPSFTMAASGRTVISAVAKQNDAAIGFIVCHRTSWTASVGGIAQAAPSGAGSGNYGARFATSGANTALGAPSGSFPAPHTAVLSTIHDVEQVSVRVNGTEYATTNPAGDSASLTAAMAIGSQNGTSTFFTGRIYGLLLIDRVLTAPEIALVERYFAKRIGVTLA